MGQWQTAPALQRTFPDHGHAPSVHSKLAAHIRVPRLVAADLVPPEVFAGFWPPEQRTIMAMPEAPVDEDRSIVLWQDQIGLPGQLFHVESVPEAPHMQGLADGHLRTCVPPPDRRHVAAAGCPVVNVSQRVSGAEP